jgi:hypothetical protein
MMKSLLFTLLLISIVTPVHANTSKIYVWRNADGILVFSDTPKPGAEQMSTKQGNVIQSTTSIEIKALDITPQEVSEQFEVGITIPKNNATIRDNTGSIYISGTIKPRFKSDLNVQLMLNEKPHGKPQKNATFSLRNIDRGEHKIKMLLLDDKGKVIASSEPVTFYMHRASTN